MYLRYNELRLLMADQGAFDAHELVSDRRDYREDAAERRPPSWVGTATKTALDFPYNALWGFPEKFYAGEPSTTGEVKGLAASPGVVEGPARFVASLDEFDQVRDGEILVCRMTNPAWVVLFTKIVGLVTEAGGAVSPPGGRGARVRHPGRGRHHERRRADQDRRPDPGQRHDGRGRDPRRDGAGVDGTRLARGGARAARRARRRGDGAGRRDVPGHPHEPGLPGAGAFLSLGARGRSCGAIEVVDGELRLGAMVTHRRVEREVDGAGRCWRARSGWSPARACATWRRSGGVLADADYASDPPAMLAALGARAVLRSPRGDRAVTRRRADPRLLRDVHRARRAAGRGARAAAAGAGDVPQVPLALERGPAVRGGRGGERRTTGCAWWSARSPRRRRTSRTCATASRPRSARGTPSGSSR